MDQAQGPPLRIGITLGDPRGVGREVTEKALARLRTEQRVEWIVAGASTEADLPFAHQFLDVGSWQANDAASAGRIAALAIERITELALRHEVDAMVTAPIEKAALVQAGYHFPGHTEMLARLTGTAAVAMMMCAEHTRLGGPLRVVLATTHLPLARVPAALSADLLVQQATLTHDALRESWHIQSPRLALCALNPHASDQGLFGDEEERIFAPAVERLRATGFAVSGPLPADTVFVRALRGEFDAVIAPYHDVGMAAFKTASFGQGVNVTLGLPFPRTSPDHGTALDIAGQGLADASSMVEALELAIRLAHSRQHLIAPMR